MVTHLCRDQVPKAASDPGAGGKSSIFPPVDRLYNMRIDRDGTWHHEGRPIARKPLVKLFASVLRREDDDSYWLVTPVERGRIDVEDVPFVIVELTAEGTGSRQMINVRSNLDEWVTIGPDHPLFLRQPNDTPPATVPIPYVSIRPKLEGRFLRSAYYDLVDLGETHQQGGITRYGVWSDGQFFSLDEHES